MADRPVFLYAAVYDDIADAEADYEAVFELHAAGLVGTFDSAVIEKEDGKVHVHKTEKPTQHGAWTGIAVGAVAGILFPPSIIGTAIAGGVAGGVAGHLWKGMSRSDLKDLGEALDDGDAAADRDRRVEGRRADREGDQARQEGDRKADRRRRRRAQAPGRGGRNGGFMNRRARRSPGRPCCYWSGR